MRRWPSWANYVTSGSRQRVTYWRNEPEYVPEHGVWVDSMDGMTQTTAEFIGEHWIDCRPIRVEKLSFFERLMAIFGI